MAKSTDLDVIGTWKLLSCVTIDDKTGEKKSLYGENPKGYITLLPGGRVTALITQNDRPIPKSDRDCAEALKSMLAYSGKYRLEDGKFITKVDIAWNEAWVGTEQERNFKIEGNRLTITALPSPLSYDAAPARAEIVWEREA
ncbi:MAG: lipocalin-like domain-containing protein [Pseudomonadota bacterium]